jgi:hypothetical protein
LKSEKDREAIEAQQKKQHTRAYIQQLRQEFIKIKKENNGAENESWRLSGETLRVDSDLPATIDRDTKVKIEKLRKDMLWNSEKETVALKKLKRKFFDDISSETIEIKAFRCNHKVQTFRTLKLTSMLDISNNSSDDSDKKNKRKQLNSAGTDESMAESAEKSSGALDKAHTQDLSKVFIISNNASRILKVSLKSESFFVPREQLS